MNILLFSQNELNNTQIESKFKQANYEIKIYNPFKAKQLFFPEFIEEFEENYKNKTKIIIIVLQKFLLSRLLNKYKNQLIIDEELHIDIIKEIKEYYT